jgi:hypothetical protein
MIVRDAAPTFAVFRSSGTPVTNHDGYTSRSARSPIAPAARQIATTSTFSLPQLSLSGLRWELSCAAVHEAWVMVLRDKVPDLLNQMDFKIQKRSR